ncbi:MAG: MxaS protein, partial [Leptothrix sp. (in: b-proteobacteria)]
MAIAPQARPQAAPALREFVYRSRDAAVGPFPGHHRSRLGDAGQEFRSHVALGQGGDARRLDLLASLRDPLGQWLVQLASERKAVPVYAVADLSASMGFVGAQRRLDVLADFTESLAWSAWRTGDPFGFVGCEARVRGDWFQPPARSRGAGTVLA